MARIQNIQIKQGNSKKFIVGGVRNAYGAPVVDFTGCSAWFSLKVNKSDADGDAVIRFTPAGTRFTFTNGVIVFELTPQETLALDPAIRYYYDIQLLTVEAELATLIEGWASVAPANTLTAAAAVSLPDTEPFYAAQSARVAIPSGVDVLDITFPTAYSTLPTIGDLFMVAPDGGENLSVWLVDTSITTTGFRVRFSAPLPATGYKLNYSAVAL